MLWLVTFKYDHSLCLIFQWHQYHPPRENAQAKIPCLKTHFVSMISDYCFGFFWEGGVQKLWDIPFLLRDYESKQKLSLILNSFRVYVLYQSQEMEFAMSYSEWNYFVTVSFYQFPLESPYSPSCFLCLWLSTLPHAPPCRVTPHPFPHLAQGRL